MLDADVILAAEKGQFNLAAWSNSHLDDELSVSAITVAEIWQGVWRATEKHRASRLRYLTALSTSLSILPYSEPPPTSMPGSGRNWKLPAR